jgi:hypothetical protein
MTIFLLIALAASGHIVAQAQEKLVPPLGTAMKCEEAKVLLDVLRYDAGDEGVIILVARRGDGEPSPKINRRLYSVWSYLHHAGPFPADRLVRAEGERVRGRGRVELYAKGKLMLILAAERPGDDIVGPKSCGSV